ncbi:hypothetical protein CDAR_42301 [Caerostris darwini]|uniref:Uncharacterized protein n=1 Tax=Caerostris darwini TaxID=1538125 RepID=A0AAV4RIE5_9ARAC|nr:hypothetical protein CDAR_42301 [Caerostris darwini]
MKKPICKTSTQADKGWEEQHLGANEEKRAKPKNRIRVGEMEILFRRGVQDRIPPLVTEGGREEWRRMGINKAVKIQTPLPPEVTEKHNEEDGVSPEVRK